MCHILGRKKMLDWNAAAQIVVFVARFCTFQFVLMEEVFLRRYLKADSKSQLFNFRFAKINFKFKTFRNMTRLTEVTLKAKIN